MKKSILMLIVGIVVGLGLTFGVYYFFFKDNQKIMECPKCQECEKCTETKCEEKECPKCEECKNNAYQDYLNGLKNNLAKLKSSGTSPLNTKVDANVLYTIDNYGINYMTLDYNGNLKISFDDNEFGKYYISKYGNSYTIKDKVLIAGHIKWGQDNSNFIWYIDSNGNFKYIDNYPEDSEPLKVRTSSIKNVVNVLSINYDDDGINPILVDIYGNYNKLK